MIEVFVRYFGMIAEVTGKSNETFELQKGDSLLELEKRLLSKYSGLKDKNYKLTVDAEIKADAETTKLGEGAEVALLPPFAGG